MLAVSVRTVHSSAIDCFHTAERTGVSWVRGRRWKRDRRRKRRCLHDGEGELNRQQAGRGEQAGGETWKQSVGIVVSACRNA